ncbi:MAG: hypothetical protein ACREQW_14335 [Candidatus Binatia bacterium]
MSSENPFDALERFAEIERLVAKVYFRFSHLFLDRPELRDFWWEMAKEEEQHRAILSACKAMIENCEDETLDPSISREKADELKARLLSYLGRGTPALGVEEAFRIALEIESSEIDAIYGKLLQLGGPNITKTMENLGVPASIQRQKLRSALREFCTDPELLKAAEQLLPLSGKSLLIPLKFARLCRR